MEIECANYLGGICADGECNDGAIVCCLYCDKTNCVIRCDETMIAGR